MLRIRIGYPPSNVETHLFLDGEMDRVKNVPEVLGPSEVLALQRQVERVDLDPAIATYLQALLAATRASPLLSLGASTRAGMNLARAARARALLRGRHYCIADDAHELAISVLSHRVRLASHVEGYVPTRDETEAALRDIVARVPVPL
jgi:MoxR-like ATPase